MNIAVQGKAAIEMDADPFENCAGLVTTIGAPEASLQVIFVIELFMGATRYSTVRVFDSFLQEELIILNVKASKSIVRMFLFMVDS